MQFQIPQYIDIEDKILGPLSFKQFVYIGGGVGLSFVFYYFIGSFIISILFIIPTLILSGLLAFYKFNNRPFSYFIEVFFYYLFDNKIYIWKKTKNKDSVPKKEMPEVKDENDIQKVSKSKLRELSWKLDMKEPEDKLNI